MTPEQHSYPSRLTPDGHFLSATNPQVNVDQREIETRALKLLATPIVQHGKQAVAQRWRIIVGRDMTPEAETRFAELIDEYTFNYILKAVNGDANYPKICYGIYGPPHRWMGLDVPGARASGGDGPDHTYSFIPIDYGARYELTGRRLSPAPADTPYTLTGSLAFTMTLGSLLGRDLLTTPDGSFTITLDPKPANGRPNHIQTTPNARYLFIRECRSDWRQIPAAHRITRLDPPTRPPLSDELVAERAVQFMVEDVASIYWFMRSFYVLEVNSITQAFGTGAISGLVQQQISFARINLADDEALVITIGHGDAAFRDIVLHDFWFRTLDYWNRTSSMNNAQGVPDEGGASTTYVVSLKDPGVHNWLDPADFHETLLVHRWQGLPRDAAPGTGPAARSQLVKLHELATVLPPGTAHTTPAERAVQLTKRHAEFMLRFAED